MSNNPISKVVDDPAVQPVFVNKVVTTFLDLNGTIVLTLGDLRYVPDKLQAQDSGTPSVYITTRIALSPSAAAEIIQALSKPLEHIKAMTAGQAMPKSQVKN